MNLGPMEIIIILVVALIVLGPERLPQAARQAGKAIAEFRRVTSGFQAEVRDVLNDTVAAAGPAPNPVADTPAAAPLPTDPTPVLATDPLDLARVAEVDQPLLTGGDPFALDDGYDDDVDVAATADAPIVDVALEPQVGSVWPLPVTADPEPEAGDAVSGVSGASGDAGDGVGPADDPPAPGTGTAG